MEVLLDTNFIISCILKRIDFMEELEGMGFKVAVPREVLQEMKDLKKDGKSSHEDRGAIDIAFQILEKVKRVRVGGKRTDEGLIAKGKEGKYIATLDSGIKREIPNKVVINNSKKGLSVERN
jgi:rRNA-processing protein FCF1